MLVSDHGALATLDSVEDTSQQRETRLDPVAGSGGRPLSGCNMSLCRQSTIRNLTGHAIVVNRRTEAPSARDDRQIIDGLPQIVLVNLSVLYDDHEILRGICDELDIGQWIAVYQQ